MKSKKFLFGVVVVLLLVTSVLPGCNKEQQLVIPSSLSPYEVVEEIFPKNPFRFIVGTSLDTTNLPKGACKEGFDGGYSEPFFGVWYIKRDGRPINQSMALILDFEVLKYQGTEFAQRSYDGIGEAYELQNLTYRNIALKAGVEPVSEEDAEIVGGVSNVSWYLIQSGCFVICIDGHDDVAQDALDRTIDTFGVEMR